MSTATNRSICRRHYDEVLTRKRLDVIDGIYSPTVGYGDGQSMPREQFKMIAGMSTTAFPDLVVTVHDQVAEGDRVVTRWSATGTHLGDFLGNAPTGKTAHIKAIHIHRVVEGRICHVWEEIDLHGLSRELGIRLP